MEENKTIAEVAPEVAPAVEETKKSVLNASVAPENFDWMRLRTTMFMVHQ